MRMTRERRLLEASAAGGNRSPVESVPVRSSGWHTVRRAFTLGTLSCTVYSSQEAVAVVATREKAMTGITLGLALEGEPTVSQGGRCVVLRPGQFAFYAAAHPFVVSASGPHSYMAVNIPLSTVGLPLVELSEIFAVELAAATPGAAMLSSMVTSLAAEHALMSARAREHCGGAVISLVRAVIGDHAGPPATKRFGLFNLLAQWIEEHLTDDDLDAESLAAAHHLSVRYVRQIFAAQGTTVTRFVRERRLEHARADLMDPAQAAYSIASIARSWRFGDASVFCRAFRARYGQAPRAYREAATGR
jgi:AraC-like DNA-binding protein